ncbi:MAG: hypothetical protein KTR15_00715 [Phycisphaeraceae bacterium]|nr:hypothetical protein [Phycisphaeraceae bacterium]
MNALARSPNSSAPSASASLVFAAGSLSLQKVRRPSAGIVAINALFIADKGRSTPCASTTSLLSVSLSDSMAWIALTHLPSSMSLSASPAGVSWIAVPLAETTKPSCDCSVGTCWICGTNGRPKPRSQPIICCPTINSKPNDTTPPNKTPSTNPSRIKYPLRHLLRPVICTALCEENRTNASIIRRRSPYQGSISWFFRLDWAFPAVFKIGALGLAIYLLRCTTN